MEPVESARVNLPLSQSKKEATSADGPSLKEWFMGHALIIVHKDLRKQLKQEQQWANQILFVRERAFCDATQIAFVSSSDVPRGYNGDHGIVIEGDFVRVSPDLGA